MSRYVFDCETDGFLDALTKVHCLVLKDADAGTRTTYNDQPGSLHPITDGARCLMNAAEIIGHNIIAFDIPALKKVYPWFTIPSEKVTDTLVLAKLYEGNIKEEDLKPQYKGTPRGALFGKQSIEAWGVRLGKAKVGTEIEDWSQWTPLMQERCEVDVEVNDLLFKRLRKRTPWPRAELLEHQAAWLCAQIERNGLRFNRDKAIKLYGELAELRHKLATELKTLFKPWVVFQGEVTSKANNKRYGHTKGAVYSKILINEFNPLSRDHIANRLKAKYGWKPDKFTDGGKPQVDETVLASLDYPEAKPLAELFLVQKRIGQIAEGDEAWLKHENDGWVHYHINPNGAVTGRATHSKFNITQVPKVGSKWGKECREMFETVAAWVLLGTDAEGLELRCLGHYMSRYDGGAYAKAVVEGKEADGTDVHSINTRALGMQPQQLYTLGGKQQKGRNAGKTWMYAFIYGAGDPKLGKILGKGRAAGKKARADLLSKVPALGELVKAVKKAVKRGFLIGLDGRHMHIRSDHAALNTLLQGAGAVICKKWMVELERILQENDYKHGWDGDYAFVIWAHDELQIAVNPKYLRPEVVGSYAQKAMEITQEYFGFKCELGVSWKIGNNWAETH